MLDDLKKQSHVAQPHAIDQRRGMATTDPTDAHCRLVGTNSNYFALISVLEWANVADDCD